MMGTFQFASPWWLLALVPVAALAWWRGRRGRSAALAFSSTALLGTAARSVRTRPGRWLAGFRIAALAFLVLALARPQIEKAETREDARGINLMLTLDFSGTMRTMDFFLDGRRMSRSQRIEEALRRIHPLAPQRPRGAGCLRSRRLPGESAHSGPRLAPLTPRRRRPTAWAPPSGPL